MARVAENIAIAVAGAWLVLMAITTSTLLPQYDSFERIWLSSLEKNPRSALSLLNLGGLATDARDLTKARDYLTRCLAIDDTSDEANANLGIVEHLSGNPAEAKKFYLRALELAPGEVNTRNNLAVLSLEQGDKQEAVRLAKEAVTMDPGYSTAHATLAWALTESRKWQQAIVELQWVLARSPHVLESRRRMATCLLALNDPGNAASHALFAVKGHPKDQDSRRLLAKAMAQVLRAEPPQSVRQKAVAAIQAGGVDALAILPMIALELRALGATAQADAVAGS
jgi:tetratricopeptide (TPR) repeat protein